MHRRTLLVVTVALLATACTGGGDGASPAPSSGASDTASFAAQVGSTDLIAKQPQEVEVGLFQSTPDGGVQLVTFGSVQLRFSFLGDGGASPQPGPKATATYLPAPTTQATGSGPSLNDPGTARGVYLARGITFDHPGVWNVEVTANVEGTGTVTVNATAFKVATTYALPGPGDRALHTQNLTIRSKDVPSSAIDSRALDGAPIPDPELHRWTIAKALDQHRPVLLIFATPTFCQSRFCGPSTDAVQQLADTYADRAVFIHVEIWKDYDKSIVNQAAADWLYRNGDLTEPWLYLIGADGIIQHRWGPLFDVNEVAHDLRALPAMKG
jgi:hypothetical protein